MLTRWRRRAGVIVACTLGWLLVAAGTAAVADPGPGGVVVVTPVGGGNGGSVGVFVGSPGSPDSNGAGSAGSGHGTVSHPVNGCTNTDATGGGCNPCTGLANATTPACVAYTHSLFCLSQNLFTVSPAAFTAYMRSVGCAATPAGPGPAPPPTPAQLAQKAYGELNLPSPTINRSPIQTNSDPQFGGQAYTWVGLWTWFWTAPNSWRPSSKTVTAGPVSATVTARPAVLMFDPGDGSGPVSCAGPGRPWTDADADNPPSGGGCGHMYSRVTDGASPLTSTVWIQWSITWTGSNGQAGAFQGLRTQASSQFIVEQIQTVNR